MGFINNYLRRSFYKIGESIGKKPVFFIVSSILISLFFGLGLIWFKWEDDFEKLFSTQNGASEKEMHIVDKLFPPDNPGSFDPSRRTRIGSYARVIIEAKDGKTLFRKAIWDEILQVDDLIHGAAPTWRHNYSSLCGKWDGECFENNVLDLGVVMDQIENGSLRVNYPIMFNPETFNIYAIPLQFGGVKVSKDGLSVDSVKAVALFYFLEPGTDTEQGFDWEQKIIDEIDYAKPFWKHINVYLRTVRTERLAQLEFLFTPLPYFGVTFVLMMVFMALTAMSSDCVRSKPYTAILGVVCAQLGSIAGIGLVSFLGVPIAAITTCVPFIMIGIGIDDTFVIMAAWRQTNPLDDVSKRLAHCYAEAGVSITITTLTDMLSFYVGLMTPVDGVQIFSAFAGTCVIFIYLLQIFLLGPCLVIGGIQEAKNRHGVLWWKEATPKSKSQGKSKFHKLFMTGGIDKADPTNKKDRSENGAMVWFQTTYSTYLLKPWFQAIVILLYLGYIGISTYGLSTMDRGLNMKLLYVPETPIYDFFEKDEEYFQNYPFRIQVLITSPVDYSDKVVQRQVRNVILQMNATGHIALEYSENWLDTYIRYFKSYADLNNLNVSDSQTFIDTLHGNFLNGSSSRIREDVKFDDDFTEIVASRFILQSKGGSTTLDLMDLIQDLRAVAENQTQFNVTVFNPLFATTDMNIIIDKLTIQLMGTACAVVMAVAILFIPSLLCSFLVFVAMVTTELGVLGIMCLWGLNLDMLTLLSLVICIGFAVDFTAHVSYAYVSTEGSSEDRIRKSMFALGVPILQGGLSTILAVSALFFLPGYTVKVMAKIITLVIGFAGFHGLLVLPVFLLILKPERFSCGSNKVNSKNKGSFDLHTSDPGEQIKEIPSISMRVNKYDIDRL